jgi:hypothetical protein
VLQIKDLGVTSRVRVATARLKVALFSVGCEESVSVADKEVTAEMESEERREMEFERRPQGREELTEPR